MRAISCQDIIDVGLKIGLCVALGAGVAAAQQAPRTPSESEIYCTGMATTDAVPTDTYVISGENANYRMTFEQGDDVFVNHGTDQGVKVGDQFEVIRPVQPGPKIPWFSAQPKLLQAMGRMYVDVGRLKVVNVQAKTSTAVVSMACDLMQRGDIVRPFTPRPAPPLHNTALDPFAAPTGKAMAMVVTKRLYGQLAGAGSVVYVNLGSAQGVKVGDYFRMFRFEGDGHELDYQERGMAYKVFGFGSAPVPYKWNDLPRQILGEGIVTRTGPNSATVVVTAATQEIYVGDYVEVE